MGKGGKYLNKGGAMPNKNNMASQQRMPAPQNQRPVNQGKKPMKKGKKIALTIGIIFLVLILLVVIGGVIYWNYLLGLMTRPEETPVQETTSDIDQMLAELTAPTDALETEPTGTTSPEETWPEIVSDENITNILLVGQAARPGETARIADTMILCSINRVDKTLTMTSFIRDLRLVWPEFIDKNGGKHTGHNRINMAYNMGTKWRDDVSGGMDLLESIIEYNFGVDVNHTVEVNFEVFENVINILGGVEVDISEEELNYLLDNYYVYFDDKQVGINKLEGYPALCYARMRKVGQGDFDRTARQREVISSLVSNLKDMGIMDIHSMFTQIMPMITTDMSNMEITNYAFEFIPMLKKLNIQSQRIPFDGTWWDTDIGKDGQADFVIDCNTKKNGEMLRQSIGMVEETE